VGQLTKANPQDKRPKITKLSYLIHLFDKRVDMLLTVTNIATFNEVLEFTGPEAASRARKLEGPQKVAGLLEVGSNSVYLVDQVLHTYDAVFTEIILDKLVVGKRDALLVDLAVTALVDELADRFQVGVAIGNVRVDNGKHLGRSLGEADEDTIVNLEEPEELKNLARFRSDLINTLNSNNKNQFRFIRNVERTLLLAQTSQTDLLPLCIAILLDVRFCALEDNTTLRLIGLLLLFQLSSASGSGLLLALSLL